MIPHDTDHLSAISTLDAGATVSLGAALGLATGDPVLAAVLGAVGGAVIRIAVAEVARQVIGYLERRRGGAK